MSVIDLPTLLLIPACLGMALVLRRALGPDRLERALRVARPLGLAAILLVLWQM